MVWILLVFAGLLETGWALGLKVIAEREQFPQLPLVPVVIGTGIAMVLSLVLLGMTMKELSLSTAYGIWVGIGLIGSIVCGLLFFDESLTAPRLLFLVLLSVGIIGLKMTQPA